MKPVQNDPFVFHAIVGLAIFFTTIAFIGTLIDYYWWKPRLVRKAIKNGKPVPERHRKTDWRAWVITLVALTATFLASVNREFLLRQDLGPLNPIIEQLFGP